MVDIALGGQDWHICVSVCVSDFQQLTELPFCRDGPFRGSYFACTPSYSVHTLIRRKFFRTEKFFITPIKHLLLMNIICKHAKHTNVKVKYFQPISKDLLISCMNWRSLHLCRTVSTGEFWRMTMKDWHHKLSVAYIYSVDVFKGRLHESQGGFGDYVYRGSIEQGCQYNVLL